MQFVKNIGVRGLDEVITSSIPKQTFIDVKGVSNIYEHNCMTNSP